MEEILLTISEMTRHHINRYSTATKAVFTGLPGTIYSPKLNRGKFVGAESFTDYVRELDRAAGKYSPGIQKVKSIQSAYQYFDLSFSLTVWVGELKQELPDMSRTYRTTKGEGRDLNLTLNELNGLEQMLQETPNHAMQVTVRPNLGRLFSGGGFRPEHTKLPYELPTLLYESLLRAQK